MCDIQFAVVVVLFWGYSVKRFQALLSRLWRPRICGKKKERKRKKKKREEKKKKKKKKVCRRDLAGAAKKSRCPHDLTCIAFVMGEEAVGF